MPHHNNSKETSGTMTTNTLSAPEATHNRNRAQAEYDAAKAHYENVRSWVNAGSGSFSAADLLAAESDMKTKNSILAAATAAHAKANKGIESTDDNLADYLVELFEGNRHEFKLTGVNFDMRKRPGKAIPASLPEVAFCQQANSAVAGGRITGECFVVVYGTDDAMPTLDSRTIAKASDKLGGSLQVGNALPAESLGQAEDGREVLRKIYRVIAKNVSPKVPVISTLPSESEVLSLANGVAKDLRAINVSSTAYGATSITRVRILSDVDTGSASVEVDRNDRKATFTVMVGTAGRYGDFGYDQILARSSTHIANFNKGLVIGNLGRIKSARIVHSSPVNASGARITVEIVGEAKTA